MQHPARGNASMVAVTVGLVCLSTVFFALIGADPRFEAATLPLLFQVGCWGIGFVLIIRRDGLNLPRGSDPGVLVMLWSFVYLIYPSVVWYRGDRIPHDIEIDASLGVLIFFLHGLFIAGFVLGYLLITKISVVRGRVDASRLPSGWALYGLPFVVLLVTALLRLTEQGEILTGTTYGEDWFALQARIELARNIGGVAYFLVQVAGKMSFYPLLIQGIGAGLLLIYAITRRRGRVRTISMLLGGVMLTLFLMGGPRSGAFIILLIAFVLTDLVVGPIRWRPLVAVMIVIFLAFSFFGYFRNYSDLGPVAGFQRAVTELRKPGSESPLSEFTSMISKEAAIVRLVEREGREGPIFLIRAAASLVPSQFFPAKAEWRSTADLASVELLGQRATAAGAGVAGAAVGDGHRLGHIWGVVVIGLLLGLLFGGARRWLLADADPVTGRPILLKAALIAGFYAWTFNVVRGDIATLMSIAIYYVIVPWLVLRLVVASDSPWMQPLPVLEQQPAPAVPRAIAPVARPRPVRESPV